ncbi:hypothetical protein [Roseateles sp.]|uniref:hypothetical protein n=1 Tax=Roseateles sp. TaxID=1971397 RepID=UPI002DFCDD40|nr:hypothetical protein [Roseateles sp.]
MSAITAECCPPSQRNGVRDRAEYANTAFRLQPLDQNPELDLVAFQKALPAGLVLEGRSDGAYIIVATLLEEDEHAQYLVDRELDRLFFLTGVRFRAEMCRRSVHADLRANWCIHARIPNNVAPLSWSYNLALQLRLWSVAFETLDPMIRMLLLFQIIELSYPAPSDFPPYLDSRLAPHPLTECKMLRHLIAHAGDADHNSLKRYCAHLGLPEVMLDRTDPTHVAAIASKLPLMELEARKCLRHAA